MNFKYFLFIVLPILTLGVIGVTTMIMTSSYIWLLATLLFWIFMSGLGIAVGYHRIFSHNCYKLKPWLDTFVLYCGVMACQSSSLTWVATHIGYHHPYSDTDKDPHTPTKGLWHAFLGWTFLISPTTINHKYAVRLMRKPAHLFCHKHYFRIVWISVLAMLLICGWKFTLFGYCIAAAISILQDNLVNILGHSPKLGYRNFELDDISSNFPILGYLGWGQGWHNNHHRYPGNFDFGIKWWEFDPCVIFIPLLNLGSMKETKKNV
jgi:fatty-acid desaturase